VNRKTKHTMLPQDPCSFWPPLHSLLFRFRFERPSKGIDFHILFLVPGSAGPPCVLNHVFSLRALSIIVGFPFAPISPAHLC
jgi:hypothetical protein